MNSQNTFMKIMSIIAISGSAIPGISADLHSTNLSPMILNFNSNDERSHWYLPDGIEWKEIPESGYVLDVTNPNKDNRVMATRPISLDAFRGNRVELSCDIAQENTTTPPYNWLGVKCMISLMDSVSGKKAWPACQGLPKGSAGFTVRSCWFDVPQGVTNANLVVGLEQSSGHASFKNITIKDVGSARVPVKHPLPDQNAPTPVQTHPDVKHLRGFMVSPNATAKDIDDIAALGANLIRYQFTRNWHQIGTDRDMKEFNEWLDTGLKTLDALMDECEKKNVRIAVDLHTPPGGRNQDKSMVMFYDRQYADAFIAIWEKIAARYKGRKAVWGYDLMNEPIETAPSPKEIGGCRGLFIETITAIRKIDSNAVIIAESPFGYEYETPLPFDNIVYSEHFYTPNNYTHQGVNGPNETRHYPGTTDGEYYDAARLRKALAHVREFQLAYNVPIYIGEFSAVRWAPGAAQYLDDVTGLFSEYGWDWSYHAFREWSGWSLEHSDSKTDQKPVETETSRMTVIKRRLTE